MSEKIKIDIMDDGPLIVSDLELLEDGEGNGLAIKKKTAL